MFEQEGYDLIGTALEVYNEIGHGFLEAVYQECLEKELKKRNIPFKSQIQLEMKYKEEILEQKYRADLIVYEGIITEIKATKILLPENQAQLMNYMKITDLKVGYLINFGNIDKLEWKRIII
ncbi:MAG: GxxExxY protein [Victivallales bacterium]|jgi:GxxExxY protein